MSTQHWNYYAATSCNYIKLLIISDATSLLPPGPRGNEHPSLLLRILLVGPQGFRKRCGVIIVATSTRLITWMWVMAFWKTLYVNPGLKNSATDYDEGPQANHLSGRRKVWFSQICNSWHRSFFILRLSIPIYVIPRQTREWHSTKLAGNNHLGSVSLRIIKRLHHWSEEGCWPGLPSLPWLLEQTIPTSSSSRDGESWKFRSNRQLVGWNIPPGCHWCSA